MAATTIADLPDDIICNILLRIPDIKSIIRCKRACKKWHNLILQPYFTKLHVLRGSLPLSLIFYYTFPLTAPPIPLTSAFSSLTMTLPALAAKMPP
ncbi:hypothetical protein RHGRI_009872 [Rhododendron griersonianum]|uniref:F-box domain-containing protein n=1 Tax=Rhododendron griersonianum TaxID=479676 RepID=A0AAV6KGD9_9ERIC|nr:hypothetical protein RHGRI_009872 [Rhododendron griersonianum]